MPERPPSGRPYDESVGRTAGAGTTPAPVPGTTTTTVASTPAVIPAIAVNAATEDRIRQEYPHLAIYLDHDELGPILRQAAEEGWSTERLQGRVFQTDWWKATSDSQRRWDALGAQDPATANRQRSEMTAEVTREIQTLGLAFNALDVNHVVETALRNGLSPTDRTAFIVGMAQARGFQVGHGSVRARQHEIQQLARAYLFPLSDAQAENLAMRVTGGSLNMDSIATWFTTAARGRFGSNPNIMTNLANGLTVADTFASTVQTIAGELGIDPSAVDLMDPKYAEVTGVRRDDGTITAMTEDEARLWARSRDEWRGTRKAKTETSNVVAGVLNFMGAR